MPKSFLTAFVAVSLLIAGVSLAQNKAYIYDSIDVDLQVNQDTTVDITERQVFNYTGEFHAGWRSIALRKISRITDIEVVDGATGQLLTYSSKRLDKLDPNSWGKFTTFRENGAQNIEWYYNLSNTTHEWVIKYRVQGALSFLKNLDELYWNLFTDYDVPVYRAQATVHIPANDFSNAQLQSFGYASSVETMSWTSGNQDFFLSASNIPAGEDLTIAAGWPRGLVDRGAFWRWWLIANWSFFLAALIILATIIYSIARWYYLEKRPEWSRTIVPEYEPPQKLKPAMAELIVKETMTNRAWSATVVDLAVRGYLEIVEEKSSAVSRFIGKWLPRFFLLPFLWVAVPSIIVALTFMGSATGKLAFIFLLFMLATIILSGRNLNKKMLGHTDYRLTMERDANTSDDLEDYEREFLRIIFGDKKTITTDELLRRNNSGFSGDGLRAQMMELQKKLYEETGLDTQAYAVPLRRWKMPAIVFVFAFVWAAMFFGGFLSFLGVSPGIVILALSIILSVLWIGQLKHNPRLNAAGVKLKQDWLGFILYLKTAEKLRLQNLTPDLFEKYLPYAIIFGLEKQWGRAFDSFNLPEPSWYHGAGAVAGGSSFAGSGGGFSASAFSSSFASSFSSAFASSSGGGGASGGGGGAGGGGGGGGGGAS